MAPTLDKATNEGGQHYSRSKQEIGFLPGQSVILAFWDIYIYTLSNDITRI